MRSPARIVSTTDGQLSGSKIVKSLALLARFGECTGRGISIAKTIAEATLDPSDASSGLCGITSKELPGKSKIARECNLTKVMIRVAKRHSQLAAQVET